jgi:hypothetical protein
MSTNIVPTASDARGLATGKWHDFGHAPEAMQGLAATHTQGKLALRVA